MTSGTTWQHLDEVEHEPETTESPSRVVPKAPNDIEETGISRDVLLGLALRLSRTTKDFTTEWLSKQLCLPSKLVLDLTEQLRVEKSLAVVGHSGTFGLRMCVTERGRARATETMTSTSYAGPAPVPLKAYTDTLEAQLGTLPQVTPEGVTNALDELVLPEETVQIAGLARYSARSLFLHGPPGNGKTSMGQLIHNAVDGELWIPHCIGIGDSIIKVFDPECHDRLPVDSREKYDRALDRRWVRIRRPFVIAGGELTIDALELSYNDALGYYEAPFHLKANAGTFLVDDFGRQRVDHEEILNRWIHPLENRVDYLTLKTGQKFPVPFHTMLIISTNLDPDKVLDAAFLRRMGYRIHMGDPSPEQFEKIFHRYAEKNGLSVSHELVATILKRYVDEERALRCSEARDLIERAKDICSFRSEPMHLDERIIDLAWRGYFGGLKLLPSEQSGA